MTRMTHDTNEMHDDTQDEGILHTNLRGMTNSQKPEDVRELKHKDDDGKNEKKGFWKKNRAPRSIKDKDRDGVDAVFHDDDDDDEFVDDDGVASHHEAEADTKKRPDAKKATSNHKKKHHHHTKEADNDEGNVNSLPVREAKDFKESLATELPSLSGTEPISTCSQMFGDKFGVCKVSDILTTNPVTGISFIFFLLTFCTIALCRYRRRNPTYRRNQHANLNVNITNPWDFTYSRDDGKGEYMAVELLEGDFEDDITTSSYAASHNYDDSDEESLESIISQWSATKDYNDACGKDDPLSLEEVNG